MLWHILFLLLYSLKNQLMQKFYGCGKYHFHQEKYSGRNDNKRQKILFFFSKFFLLCQKSIPNIVFLQIEFPKMTFLNLYLVVHRNCRTKIKIHSIIWQNLFEMTRIINFADVPNRWWKWKKLERVLWIIHRCILYGEFYDGLSCTDDYS